MRRTKKGFTLIELVIVVAVLVILAAIAIPVVSGVISDANTSVDKANAQTIETAVKLYAAKNSVSTIDAAGVAAALTAASLGDIQTKTTGSFLVNATTMAVTIGAQTTSPVSDSFKDVAVG